jgi:hypothetical protein
MSRDPIVSSNNDAETALSDDEQDGVVGGRGTRTCSHSQTTAHDIIDPITKVKTGTCPGPDDGTTMY